MAQLKTFGEHIRWLREQRDLSVRELAKSLAVSAAFLSDVELGRRYPSDEVLERMAKVLKRPVADLKMHDARAPVQELRRIAATNPAMGFALRRVVDDGISPEELLEMLKKRRPEKGQ